MAAHRMDTKPYAGDQVCFSEEITFKLSFKRPK